MHVPSSLRRTGSPIARSRRLTVSALLGALATFLLPAVGLGQASRAPRAGSEPYRIRATAVAKGPDVDGRLDDEVWRSAEPITGFTQRNPVEGAPATQRTEIRMLYTPTVLFVGARMYDADPDRLVVTQMRRDKSLDGDDNLSIILDTFRDLRNGFVFTVNPAGARYDAYVTNEGKNVDADFNAVWDVRTSRDGEGWVAEIAIPLSQLRFPDHAGEQVWGVNFARVIRRNFEDTYWVPVPRDFGSSGFFRLSNAGELVGLEGLEQGTNLQVKPYLTGGLSATRELNVTPGVHRLTRDGVADAGVDLKYSLTSNLVLDLTTNTDFGQVEADQEQVNLTRFSLYFPEKRDFFLESARTFASGIGGQELQLFYSRRIGLQGDREVPILGGAKLTGRTGLWTVGAMSVLTKDMEIADTVAVPRTLWSVVSLRRNVLRRSTVGVMAMSKDPAQGDANRTLGADANLALGQHTSVTAQVGKVFDPTLEGDTWAASAAFDWSTDLFGINAGYRQVGEDFRADMGFVRRTGYRETTSRLTFSPRPGRLGIRQSRAMLSGSYLDDGSGRLLTRSVQFKVCNFLENTGRFCPAVNRQFEFLERPFRIFRDPDTGETVVIDPGRYEWYEFSAPWSTDTRRTVVVGGRLGFGGYYGGDKKSASLNFTWRPDTRLTGTLSLSRDALRELGPDESGAFDANVLGARLEYAFSPFLFTKAYLQYNDSRNAIVSNFLLHWIIRDGTEVYVVYNEVYDSSPAPLRRDFDPTATSRTLVVKFTYLLLR